MIARDYQERAIALTVEKFVNHQSTLNVMATGTGKTVCFAHLIDRSSKKRSMVIAHREELIFQAQEKIRAVTGTLAEIEMGTMYATGGMFGGRIVIASIMSLVSGQNKKRFERFNPDDFDLIVIDECHHSFSKSYRAVLAHFFQNEQCKVVGFTATPDRADKKALGQIFDSVAMEYEILDAVTDGWLCPVMERFVTINDLDLSKCRTTAGDLNGADLAEAMEYEAVLHEMATPTIELCGDRKAIVFTASVAQAERFCEILNRHKSDSAQWVCGETPKEIRRDMLEDYAKRRFQFLVNVGVCTEGYDDPGTEVIVLGRPTKSRALFTQMVGRGLRPLPGIVDNLENSDFRRSAILASTKPQCEIIDFVGNTGKHKLMTTADILGGEYDDSIIELATRTAKKSSTPVDMREALRAAARQQHEEMEREKRREEAKRLNIKASVKYSSQIINPFDVLDVVPFHERAGHVGKPITDKQKTFLEKHGINPSMVENSNQASQIIGKIMQNIGGDKPTFKQLTTLRRYGVTAQTKAEATRKIGAIAANGWKVPKHLQELQPA